MAIEFSPSTKIIIDEAVKRGIATKTMIPGRIILFKKDNHEEILFDQFSSKTTSVALKCCNNKHLCKSLLKSAGISVANGEEFRKGREQEALSYAEKIGFPLVVKPLDSSHGNGVFVGIKDKNELMEKISQTEKFSSNYLIEEQFEGKEYRVFATKTKVLGVTRRVPANVAGDGKSTISELIDRKNQDSRRGESIFIKPLVKIKIDQTVLANLSELKLSLSSTPRQDEVVYLRKNSNLSTGGDSIDYTDNVHDSVKEVAVRSIAAIPGLEYGGIDFLSKDIRKKQTPGDYIIIEINASPAISMHHFPHEGKSRDVAKEIINSMFPETIKVE